MAEREFYIGSTGPFFYDDTNQYQNGDFHQGIYDPNGSYPTTGFTGAVIVVVNTRNNVGAIEVKTATITVSNGLITSISDASDWTATPLA